MTIETRWYAFVRIEDNVVVLRSIEVELTPKLIRPTKRYELSGTGLLHVQWLRDPGESDYKCPLATNREDAMADLRRRLHTQQQTLQKQLQETEDSLRMAHGPLVEKKGKLTTWWEGVASEANDLAEDLRQRLNTAALNVGFNLAIGRLERPSERRARVDVDALEQLITEYTNLRRGPS